MPGKGPVPGQEHNAGRARYAGRPQGHARQERGAAPHPGRAMLKNKVKVITNVRKMHFTSVIVKCSKRKYIVGSSWHYYPQPRGSDCLRPG